MRKSSIWLVVAVFVTVVAISFVFFSDKVTVTASDAVLLDQGWHANFSAPLKKDALDSDELYVADHNGKRVNAEFSLTDSGKTVHVNGLEPGTYTLHVKKGAINGKLLESAPAKQIQFTVHETIESIASAKELEAYFERAKSMQKRAYGEVTSEMESAESSSLNADTANSAASSAGGDHSSTNNQVEGVDEADLVKTDGNYIYSTLGNGKVVITDIRNPQQIQKASEITMEEGYYPSQLFLHDQTLIVIGDKYVPYPNEEKSDEKMSHHAGEWNDNSAVVQCRKSAKTIPHSGNRCRRLFERRKENRRYAIHGHQCATEFLGDGKIGGRCTSSACADSAEGDSPELIDYKDIAILPGAMEPSYSVITAIDLSAPAENKVVTKGYLGSSEQLYMSEENLYLTATIYETNSPDTRVSSTMLWNPATADSELFKFSLNGTDCHIPQFGQAERTFAQPVFDG